MSNKTINTKINTESQYKNKFVIRHVKSNAEVRVLFNPENTTYQEIVSSLINHYALVEALQDIIDCQYNPTKTLANLNGAISNAQELLNNINESK